MSEWRTVELINGPLDGGDVRLPADYRDGVAMIADGCAYMGGRAVYDPRPDDDDPDRLYWVCDIP